MSVSRRTLLLHIPVVLAAPLALPGAHAAPSAAAVDLGPCAPTLVRFVDTLLPAHGASPAASELGIATRLLDEAAGRPRYAQLIAAGCEWLDAAARAAGGVRFAALDEAAREIIVGTAAQQRAGDVARFFFHAHRHALELFYSDPRAWPALDYSGPPQPAGFTDHDRPPRPGAA